MHKELYSNWPPPLKSLKDIVPTTGYRWIIHLLNGLQICDWRLFMSHCNFVNRTRSQYVYYWLFNDSPISLSVHWPGRSSTPHRLWKSTVSTCMALCTQFWAFLNEFAPPRLNNNYSWCLLIGNLKSSYRIDSKTVKDSNQPGCGIFLAASTWTRIKWNAALSLVDISMDT